ncbi:UNVERIFIED_ORG: hypothetical protein ABRZ91_003131 [Heyndrickxia coagulans]
MKKYFQGIIPPVCTILDNNSQLDREGMGPINRFFNQRQCRWFTIPRKQWGIYTNDNGRENGNY